MSKKSAGTIKNGAKTIENTVEITANTPETNWCTLEDIKAAPSGRQFDDREPVRRRRKLSLKEIDEWGRLLWESGDN